jgi:hypothetical protein
LLIGEIRLAPGRPHAAGFFVVSCRQAVIGLQRLRDLIGSSKRDGWLLSLAMVQ